MKIVIDIPDKDFLFLREEYGEVELDTTLNLRLQSAVAHGTPLVTCKDCKHQIKEYCSEAERKGGGE